MLLDSGTSLKVAHDIIHDANEFFKKWGWLLADPSNPPENSTVQDGYVEFTYADGGVVHIPCSWSIFESTDGNVRDKVILRLGEQYGELRPAYMGDAIGVSCNSPVAPGTIIASRLVGKVEGTSTEENSPIELVGAQVTKVEGHNANVLDCTISSLVGNDFKLVDNLYQDVIATEGDAAPENFKAEEMAAAEMHCTGERLVAVEKINAWIPPNAYVTPPETDGKYTGYIPFNALSDSGTPMNGFDRELERNPFYPDWIYVSINSAPWLPTYAWMPSATMPSVPYWQDSDKIYWYKARITTPAQFGALCSIWPIRTSSDKNYAESTTPPMKASSDGMVVMVNVLTTSEVPISVSDHYILQDDGTWALLPGELCMLKGPSIMPFMAKRNFILVAGRITEVEYQFLPMGDLND